MILLDPEKLREFMEQILLSAGMDSYSAAATAEGLVLASLRGVDSHGIQLLPHYVEELKSGRINKNPDFKFERTGQSTGMLDADHSIGFSAGQKAVERCIEIAGESGIGAVTVSNSSHGGMMAYYCLEPAKKGFFVLAAANTTPRLIPVNARRAFLGTNPLCYAFPMKDEEPLCYDSATTQITGNKIKLHRKLGKKLPEGVAADINGNPTTNAYIAELLYPFGDYKGFGIALLVDILCGALTGMANSENVSAMYGEDISGKRLLGQFFMAVDINKFRPLKQFTEDLQDEINRLRSLPAQEGRAVIAPGDPEKMISKERLEKGIPVDEKIFNMIAGLTGSDHSIIIKN